MEVNERDAILGATHRLLEEICRQNAIGPDVIISVLFTLTDDLDAVFPAEAARRLGWSDVPLMCAREIPVAGSLPKIVRVLVHAYVEGGLKDVRHVYQGRAAALRPDIAPEGGVPAS